MEFQIRTTELTNAQIELESEYYTARQVLRELGFDPEYNQLFCSSPNDQPGCIYLRGHGIK